MRRQLLTGLRMTACLVVVLGLLYPFTVFVVGRVAFADRADGSYVTNTSGQVVGSSLIGQRFVTADGSPDARYFQPRPSAAGTGYDAMASGASNLGPSNPKLIAPPTGPDCYLVPQVDASGNQVVGADGQPAQVCSTDTVPGRADAYRSFNGLAPDTQVPVDAVTASGSGLDPQISVANARLQAPRVAQARALPVATVLALVDRHTAGRAWGFLGEKGVNVLELNLDLNRQT